MYFVGVVFVLLLGFGILYLAAPKFSSKYILKEKYGPKPKAFIKKASISLLLAAAIMIIADLLIPAGIIWPRYLLTIAFCFTLMAAIKGYRWKK